MSPRRLGLALLLAAWPSVSPAHAEKVTFSFAPSAGRSYLVEEISQQTSKVAAKREDLVISGRSTMEIARDGQRWAIRLHVDSLLVTKDGATLDSPMFAAIRGSRAIQVIRPDGGFDHLEGARALYDRMLAAASGEERERLLDRGKAPLDTSERASWYERVEVFAGQTLELDRDYFFESAYPVGGDGWVPHQVLFRLGPWVETPIGRLLKVSLAYVADARRQVPAAQPVVSRIASGFTPRALRPIASDVTLEGAGWRLIDPTTLTVFQEQIVHRLRQPLRVDESLGLTLTLVDQVDYKLTPVAPPGPHSDQEKKP